MIIFYGWMKYLYPVPELMQSWFSLGVDWQLDSLLLLKKRLSDLRLWRNAAKTDGRAFFIGA